MNSKIDVLEKLIALRNLTDLLCQIQISPNWIHLLLLLVRKMNKIKLKAKNIPFLKSATIHFHAFVRWWWC